MIQSRNIALFGGTFDPVHFGHLAAAKAAARRFHLDRVLFVPSGAPPHKRSRPLTPFAHRYAMLALATAGESRFEPSLLEAENSGAHYSIETVRRMKRTFGRGERLFFLIGVDAFLDIATWRRSDDLLQECDFIVVSRPGFRLQDVLEALPPTARKAALLRNPRSLGKASLSLGRTKIHLLESVRVGVSATEVRRAARRGQPLGRLVPATVADYIRKMGLYRRQAGRR
ncbi:MAG: nicotinate-nucleotide adenylyltransferase [Acidobacteria bacterium]|nr:nicotinate-nucleotide adenylyltransferase [Acidobacteriota bacterium]